MSSWYMQVMHMEPHEFSELEKVEATDDAAEASTSRPASGMCPALPCPPAPALPCLGLPCPALSRPALPCPTVICHAMPHGLLSPNLLLLSPAAEQQPAFLLGAGFMNETSDGQAVCTTLLRLVDKLVKQYPTALKDDAAALHRDRPMPHRSPLASLWFTRAQKCIFAPSSSCACFVTADKPAEPVELYVSSHTL